MDLELSSHDFDTVQVDVLVLGGGMAGHRAAVSARQQGCDVAHAYLARGASTYMICANVPLGCEDPRDGPEAYAEDTLRAGYGINERQLVHALATNAVESFNDLLALGIDFVRSGDGYAQRHLSGSTYPRGVYTSEGGMGPVIISRLAQRAHERGVSIFNGHYVAALLMDQDDVSGALLLDYRTGKMTSVQARAVVLAMGGVGRLYDGSTYPADVSADSYVLALEAGASLHDMEFVQFEPTVTAYPEGCRGMEMPTAMLGDGAHLINSAGERFMFRYNPANGERLVEKARMALCIQQEIDEGRGLPDGTVLFDTTVMPQQKLESYTSHCKRLRRAGLEPTTEMVQVRPAAHSIMGGTWIDHNGYTGVPGLYACGEASGGMHGASRIAGNSGAETLVMGWRVGAAAARAAGDRKHVSNSPRIAQQALERFLGAGTRQEHPDVKLEIRKAMAQSGGLYRTGCALQVGIEALDGALRDAQELGGETVREVINARTTRNMAVIGRIILRAALTRAESRGAHQRVDFPHQDDDAWLRHIGLLQSATGELLVGSLPIH